MKIRFRLNGIVSIFIGRFLVTVLNINIDAKVRYHCNVVNTDKGTKYLCTCKFLNKYFLGDTSEEAYKLCKEEASRFIFQYLSGMVSWSHFGEPIYDDKDYYL